MRNLKECFRDESGVSFPLVIAVTLSLLLILCGVMEYMRLNLMAAGVKEAVQDGCDVIGYTWWGPIDLISSGTSEMSKRYGFIYVDQDENGQGSKRRYCKDSYAAYKQIIETNGEEL